MNTIVTWTAANATTGTTNCVFRVRIAGTAFSNVPVNLVRLKFFLRAQTWTAGVIGLRATSGDAWDIDPETMRMVKVGGATSFATSATTATYSDPVDLEIDGSRDVVISFHHTGAAYRFGTVVSFVYSYYKNGTTAGATDADTTMTGLWAQQPVMVHALEGEYVPPPGTPVVSALDQPWQLTASRLGALRQVYAITFGQVAVGVESLWSLFATVPPAALAQPWGLRMGRDLVAPWGNAPVRVAGLAQPWRDAGELVRGLVQPWHDAAPLAAGLAQEWDILGALASGLVQPWAIAADAALVGSLAQGWDLRDVVPLATDLAQPWTIGTDPSLLRYTLTVTVDGHAVQVDSLTLEADLDQDALHATISLGTLADYQRCRDLAPVAVRVAINGGAAEEYHLVQTSARIDERHGETRYEVQAESALVLLGAPYAEPVAVEEYTGAASVIAAALCAPISLAWQTVDWTLPAGALVAAGETPLELLKRLSAAVGAVVQARPDGSVRVAPEYPISLPAWPTAAPDLVWVETERSEQVAGQPERRAGYNKYLIGETLTAADSLRLEEETVSETVKLVRGYQVPWTGLFGLVHTGGSWVQVEDMGVETRQETEVVEIVAGEGRVRYPIQSRDSVRWLHTTLGALTVSEDGTVRADVAGQSLCEITYTTRCRKWRVRDGRNEQLQLVAEI